MRQKFNQEEFIGWKFSRTEAAHLSSHLMPLVKASTHREKKFIQHMTNEFLEEMPFLSIKQKEWLDIIITRQGFSNLSHICEQVKAIRWSGDIDSLISFIQSLTPLMDGEFIWFYEYNPSALAYGKTPVEILTSDCDAYLGFENRSDARMVISEITHKLQAIV